ncbi:MAG: hypothetical protein AABX13_02290 [Nanoarchaeota archaeon]
MSSRLGSKYGLASIRSFGQVEVYNPDRKRPQQTDRNRQILYDYLEQRYASRVEGAGLEAVTYFSASDIEQLVRETPLLQEKRDLLESRLRELVQSSLVPGYVPRERLVRELDRARSLGEIVRYCREKIK